VETPKTFDWVTARSKCSLEAVFQVLDEVVDSDVKKANGLGRRGVSFQLNRLTANKFLVMRNRDFGGIPELDTVVFELNAREITVSRRDARGAAEMFLRATPAFRLHGE
jgi:hypothetical protein